MSKNEPEDEGGARRHHQHGVHRGVRRADRPGRLHRVQGRDRRHVPDDGPDLAASASACWRSRRVCSPPGSPRASPTSSPSSSPRTRRSRSGWAGRRSTPAGGRDRRERDAQRPVHPARCRPALRPEVSSRRDSHYAVAPWRQFADHVISALTTSGVRRVYGLPGDSLNGFTDAIRRSGEITWEHVRHEETAAFAAAADAALTGQLAVCAGSCGPGNLHLINGLFDAQRSRVPVLAIAAHIPRTEIGSEYFQETHPQDLFRECSVYCELVSTPEMAPRILEMAMRAAVEENGVAVVVIPGEIFLQSADATAWQSRPIVATRSVVCPDDESLRAGGRDPQRRRGRHDSRRRRCGGSHDALIQLAAHARVRRSCMRCAARSSSNTTTRSTSA